MKLQLTHLFLMIEDYMLPCMNKKLFGIDCPGCGMQRSAFLLIKGEFAAAFEMYPAIYPMILLFTFIGINRFYSFKFENTIMNSLIIVTVGAILINYILKFT